MTEDQSPFKLSKTQTIFKNAANVTLRGSTFDAIHMDKFLQSGFGETSIMMGNYNESPKAGAFSRTTIGPGGGGGSNLMSYMAS
jgi:hypothetical protein